MKAGPSKKRWLDMVEKDCAEMGMNILEATRRAQDRQLCTYNTFRHILKPVQSWLNLAYCFGDAFSI